MKLFLSGNFPQLVSPEKEKSFRDTLLNNGKNYHRLITFFYPKHCQTVLTLQKELLNESEKK